MRAAARVDETALTRRERQSPGRMEIGVDVDLALWPDR